MAKRMLEAQKLEKLLWVEAVTNAVYTVNQYPMRALRSVILEETWSGRRPCVAHMCVCISIAHAMVLDEKRDKLNAKKSNIYFLNILKVQRHVGCRIWNKKIIIKIKDVVFMKDGGSIRNDFEMCPSGRMKALRRWW